MRRVQYEGELKYRESAGIVDAGTTRMFASPLLHALSLDLTQISSSLDVLLANNFFAVYLDAIPGAKLDSHTGKSKSPLPPSRPCSVSTSRSLTGSANSNRPEHSMGWRCWYSVVANLGSNSGEWLNFILGQKWYYYVVSSGWASEKRELIDHSWQVFDRDANRVGFSQT